MKLKIIGIILAIVFLYFMPDALAYGGSSQNFTFTINTSKYTGTYIGESNSSQFWLPLLGSGTFNFTVNWGDGTSNSYTDWFSGTGYHTYPSPGVYTININGTIDGFGFQGWGDAEKLINISNWGPVRFGTSSNGVFQGCKNFKNITATDTLNLSGVTDLSFTFYQATVFNGNISNWNTSDVTYTGYMFYNAQAFNQPLDSWKMGQVYSMNLMFDHATSFNQPLNSWNVSSLQYAVQMFSNSAFNQNLTNWDVRNLIDATDMFSYLTTFNGNISTWNTTNLKVMQNMFNGASAFNQNINSWNTSLVINMYSLFSGASSFNQPLNNWNVTKVTTMGYMFYGAHAFNQPLSNWKTNSLTDMQWMFYDSTLFDQDISNFNISQVNSMIYLFPFSSISKTNYTKILIGFAKQTILSSVTLNAGGVQYCSRASTSRASLVSAGWTITDGGLDSTCYVDTCTYNGFDNPWALNVSDNCTLSSDINLGGNFITINGNNGKITINATITAKKISLNPSAFNKNFTIQVNPGKRLAAIK